MNARTTIVALAIGGAWLGSAAPLGAHRLDEYLQATRLSVDHDRVHVEIDLTPGVSIASDVVAWIDTDRDGQISTGEGEAYARDVVGSMALRIDGRPVPVVLVDRQFPALRDMKDGVGAIRVRATAHMPSIAVGPHQLWFRNVHRSTQSVYLANALVPEDPQVVITGQGRDEAQHELTLDYRVVGGESVGGSIWWFAGIGLIGLVAYVRSAFRRIRHGPAEAGPHEKEHLITGSVA